MYSTGRAAIYCTGSVLISRAVLLPTVPQACPHSEVPAVSSTSSYMKTLLQQFMINFWLFFPLREFTYFFIFRICNVQYLRNLQTKWLNYIISEIYVRVMISVAPAKLQRLWSPLHFLWLESAEDEIGFKTRQFYSLQSHSSRLMTLNKGEILWQLFT